MEELNNLVEEIWNFWSKYSIYTELMEEYKTEENFKKSVKNNLTHNIQEELDFLNEALESGWDENSGEYKNIIILSNKIKNYQRFKVKYDFIEFLNTLLQRAKIDIKLFLTKKRKLIHVYDYEENKVMFKTEEETLNFVLNQCGLHLNTRTTEEKEMLENIETKIFTKL